MDRAEVERLLRSVESHADVALDMLRDPTLSDRGRELEIMARANYIEARLNQLRAEFVGRSSGRPDSVYLPDVIRDAFGTSGSEARRLIALGAVRIDDDVVTDLDVPTAPGARLTVGTRRHHILGAREPFTDDLRGERDR